MTKKLKQLSEKHGIMLIVTILLAFFGMVCSVLLGLMLFTAEIMVDKIDKTNALSHNNQLVQQKMLREIDFQCDVIDENKFKLKALDGRVIRNSNDIYKLQVNFNEVIR